jgi:hypothetical protein
VPPPPDTRRRKLKKNKLGRRTDLVGPPTSSPSALSLALGEGFPKNKKKNKKIFAECPSRAALGEDV